MDCLQLASLEPWRLSQMIFSSRLSLTLVQHFSCPDLSHAILSQSISFQLLSLHGLAHTTHSPVLFFITLVFLCQTHLFQSSLLISDSHLLNLSPWDLHLWKFSTANFSYPDSLISNPSPLEPLSLKLTFCRTSFTRSFLDFLKLMITYSKSKVSQSSCLMPRSTK